jgi:hypothetical protein
MWSAAALVETHAVSNNQEVNEDVNSFLSHLNLSTFFDQMDLHKALIIQITPKVAILAMPNKYFFGSVKIYWKMRMIHLSKQRLAKGNTSKRDHSPISYIILKEKVSLSGNLSSA